jgi:hypothetical protein
LAVVALAAHQITQPLQVVQIPYLVPLHLLAAAVALAR